MVTVALAFNILVFFSLFLSLVALALTFTSLSVFLIWSTHPTSAADQLIKPTQSLIKLLIVACHWFLVVWPVGFGLGGWWFGFRIEWILDWVSFRLSGFRLEWLGFPWWCWLGGWWWWLGVEWSSDDDDDDGGWVCERERGEWENNKYCIRMNILLNKCVE